MDVSLPYWRFVKSSDVVFEGLVGLCPHDLDWRLFVLSHCESELLHLFHSCSSVADVVSVISLPKWRPSLRHHGLVSFAQARCWVVGIVMCWLADSCCRVVDFLLCWLSGLHCRDAAWYITVHRLVLSSSSCFAWCQIACNMARASLSCPIFAVTTSSIYPLTLGFCR